MLLPEGPSHYTPPWAQDLLQPRTPPTAHAPASGRAEAVLSASLAGCAGFHADLG